MEAPGIMPVAHEKWFLDDPGNFPADWGFFFEAPTLILVGAAVIVAMLAISSCSPRESSACG
jgi:hypothetical protein